jgi:hypothetical protein
MHLTKQARAKTNYRTMPLSKRFVLIRNNGVESAAPASV